MTKKEAVREIYFEATTKRTSVTAYKRMLRACRALGLSKEEAKATVLSLGDFCGTGLLLKLLDAQEITLQEGIAANSYLERVLAQRSSVVAG